MAKRSAVRAVLERSLRLDSDESLLVVTDTIKESLARPFYEYGKRICRECRIEVMEPLKENGQEPPKKVADLMASHDAIVMITDKSLTHTMARRKANGNGARIASMPGITKDVINRSLDVDYNELRRSSEKLAKLLRHARTVKVLTEKGTDMTVEMGLGLHPGDGALDKKGSFDNLPAGEVSFAPVGCSGTFIVDASFPGFGKLDSPLTFSVLGGRVHRIEGEKAKELEAKLDRIGPGAYVIAELGIGTNPDARICGIVLEDEKVLGTCHIALGNNVSYGGMNDVPIHLDGVMLDPTIIVDEAIVMEKGKPFF